MIIDHTTTGWWFGTMEFYFSHHIGNFITPTDEHIFFRGVGSTTNQILIKLADSSQLVSGLASLTPTQLDTDNIFIRINIPLTKPFIYIIILE